MYSEEERAIHVVFLQLTTDPAHDIYIKGLNQVRDVLSTKWKRDKGLDGYYHYVLVLLIQDEERSQIPRWKHVLVNSKDRKKDTTWHPNNLWQYVMFVPMKEPFKPSSEGYMDVTENGLRGDDLEPELPLSVDDAESSKADTRKGSSKPAAKNKALVKGRKALTKKKQELTKGKPSNSRKRKFEAKVGEEEKGETEEATQEEGRSKRARQDINYKE